MLKGISLSEDRSYITGSESEPVQFYSDCLNNSKQVDLLIGYFNSAAITNISFRLASFLSNGGTMRLIVNDVQSQTIELDENRKHFFSCLAWMISEEKIQIKIIQPKNGKGITHFKSGIFSDGVDMISFDAYSNFNATGSLKFFQELESEIYLSWEKGRSIKMIENRRSEFENIFSGSSDDVVETSDEIFLKTIRNEFGNISLVELLQSEKKLLEISN